MTGQMAERGCAVRSDSLSVCPQIESHRAVVIANDGRARRNQRIDSREVIGLELDIRRGEIICDLFQGSGMDDLSDDAELRNGASF